VQQLPGQAILPWRNITEIWLIRVAVALAAILESEYCTRSLWSFKTPGTTDPATEPYTPEDFESHLLSWDWMLIVPNWEACLAG